MALISVIVPVYNVEKYLYRCVDSILSQSFPDFELILVDDGSSDASGSLCDAYAARDGRVHVIHQENGGQAAAKNAGLDFAYQNGCGEWISFIDSDDWIHPRYLELLYNAAIGNSTQISLCGIAETDGVLPVPQAEAFPVSLLTAEEMWLRDRTVSTIPVCKLCAAAVFRELRFPIGRVHEDEFVLYRALFSGKSAAYVDAALYYYYQNPDGITLQKEWTPARADTVQAFSEQCAFFRKNGFRKAELLSAQGLLSSVVFALHQLNNNYPEENALIRSMRVILRKTKRRYGSVLDYSGIGGKKGYEKLAHPTITKLRRKNTHVMLFLRRLFHA